MPINIETKNILTPFPPKPSAATAGPGHKPAIAHPIPNKTDPAIKSLLTFWLAGVGKFSANNGNSQLPKTQRMETMGNAELDRISMLIPNCPEIAKIAKSPTAHAPVVGLRSL